MEAEIQDEQAEMQDEEAEIQDEEAGFQDEETGIQDEEAEMQDEEAEMQDEEAEMQDEEAGIDDEEAAIDDEEAGIEDEEAGIDDEEAEIEDEEAGIEDEEAGIDDEEAGIQDVVEQDLVETLELIDIVEAELVHIQPKDRNLQTILELTEKRFLLSVLLAGLIFGEERSEFVFRKAAESLRSDIYMLPGEHVSTYLIKLILEFKQQQLKGFDETDNRKYRAICNVYTRIGMYLTEQERIGLHIDMEEDD